MITPENFADALRVMGFAKSGNTYEKEFPAFGVSLKAAAQKRKEALLSQREQAIEKYFR